MQICVEFTLDNKNQYVLTSLVIKLEPNCRTGVKLEV